MSYQIQTNVPYEGTWVEHFGSWEDLVEGVVRAGQRGYTFEVYEVVREIPIEEILG